MRKIFTLNMRKPRFLFFTFIVISAITQTYSAPPAKTPITINSSGKELPKIDLTKESGAQELRELLRSLAENPIDTLFKTESKPVIASFGEPGYLDPGNFESPQAKLSNNPYREDSMIISPDNKKLDLSDIESLNKPEKEQEFSPESKKPLEEELDSKKIETDKSDVDSQKTKVLSKPMLTNGGPIKSSLEIPHSIRFASPDRIGEETIKVPREIKGNFDLFKKWFIETLPDRGFYEEIHESGPSNGERVQSIEFSKLRFNEQDPFKAIQSRDKTKSVVPESVELKYYDIYYKEKMREVKNVLDGRDQDRKWDSYMVPKTGTYKINFKPENEMNVKLFKKEADEFTPLVVNRGRLYGEKAERQESEDGFVAPHQIRVTSVDRISETFEVPAEVKNDRDLYEEWFVDMLPENGFYQEIYEKSTDDNDRVKSLEFSRLRFTKKDSRRWTSTKKAPKNVPRSITVQSANRGVQTFNVPKRAMSSPESFWMWFTDTLPTKGTYEAFYKEPKVILPQKKKGTGYELLPEQM